MAAHVLTRCQLPGGIVLHLLTDRADRMVGETIRRTGLWEPAETALVRALVAPGELAVDGGAHVGYFTMLLSRLVGPAGRVMAFEPEAGNFALLRANCIINGCGNVAVERLALGEQAGAADLHLAEGNLGDHRLHLTPGRARQKVEMVCLDASWADRRLDFLKLDTQGSELRILAGASRTIAANAAHLLCLMELSPGLCTAAGHDLDGLLGLLGRLGAVVFPAAPVVGKERPMPHAALAALWRQLLAAPADDANASLLLAFSPAGADRLRTRLAGAARA